MNFGSGSSGADKAREAGTPRGIASGDKAGGATHGSSMTQIDANRLPCGAAAGAGPAILSSK